MEQMRRFFAPPVFENEYENRRARIVNTILQMVVFGSTLLMIASIIDGQRAGLRVSSMVVLFGLGLWWIFKRGNLLIPGYGFPMVVLGGLLYLMLHGDGIRDEVVLGLPIVIVLGSFIVGGKSSLFFTIMVMAGVTAVGVAEIAGIETNDFSFKTDYFDIVLMDILIATTGGLLYVLVKNITESLDIAYKNEQNALASNRELAAIRRDLEVRVAERTRDLTLSAEIGRAVTQQRNLNLLLTEAVENIRQTFSLYYVQIYLTDPSGRILILRSGSGSVGKELLQRGHRLPITTNSINGTAASTRTTVLVEDTSTSATFFPNPLLPKTRSEASVPLLAGQKVLGVLNMQSEYPETFTQETLPAYEILAGQIAAALENAYQFTEIEKARVQIESQSRLLTREGWNTYLDAVRNPEFLGMKFEGGTVEPLTVPAAAQGPEINIPITIAGAEIGAIQLETTAGILLEEEQEIVARLATLAGQHLENLRLLTEAERYRREAEQAIRRLTREGWSDYHQREGAEAENRFTYTNKRVVPFKPSHPEETPTYQHPLTLHGEPIGALELALPEGNPSLDVDTAELVATIGTALTNHIENLRLSQATETALFQTEEQARRLTQLNDMSTALNQATKIEDLRKITLQKAPKILRAEVAGLAILTSDEQAMEAFIEQNGEVIQIIAPEGTAIPLANTSAEQVMQTRRIHIIPDTSKSPLLDLQDMARSGMITAIQAPLVLGTRVLGVINVMSFSKTRQFSEQDAAILQQIASVVATTLENLRLLQDATKRAERETLINVINQRVQSATTVESALEIATREIGHLLKARRAVVEIGFPTQNGQ